MCIWKGGLTLRPTPGKDDMGGGAYEVRNGDFGGGFEFRRKVDDDSTPDPSRWGSSVSARGEIHLNRICSFILSFTYTTTFGRDEGGKIPCRTTTSVSTGVFMIGAESPVLHPLNWIRDSAYLGRWTPRFVHGPKDPATGPGLRSRR